MSDAATARLVLVTVDTELPPGLLGASAWDALRGVDGVLCTLEDPEWEGALAAAWVEPIPLRRHGSSGPPSRDALTGALAGIARVGRGAWLLDHRRLQEAREVTAQALMLADASVEDLAVIPAPSPRPLPDHGTEPDPPIGSGTAPPADPRQTTAHPDVDRAIEIVDALRSPGGDAWSAEQTHSSLARYLLEESHEVLEVIEQMPPGIAQERALQDELGDILFQILFHARLGAEAETPWSVEDVAAAMSRKMLRRNPHVFSPDASLLEDRTDVDGIIAQWHAAKRAEGKSAALTADLPRGLPALQAATKVTHRARTAGSGRALLDLAERIAQHADPGERAPLRLAAAILRVVAEGEADDIDAESALRRMIGRIGAREVDMETTEGNATT